MASFKSLIVLSFKGFLLLIVLSGFISSAVSAVVTVIPDSSASKESMLGYESHCSFAPISTIILIVMAIAFGIVLFKKYAKRALLSSPIRAQLK
ncbi:MAG: hypothetical protein JSV94_05375 [Methanobacteriota archaeon]|nr:MAG: hypothetical protein JSV94_05375 [Euryarchaeota archaeon]